MATVESGSAPELIDLWKRSEQLRFDEYLRSVEHDRFEATRMELTKIKKVEAKLRMKLLKLENKEREIDATEANLRRGQEELSLKLRRLVDDHASRIKLLSEQHAVALMIEKDKLKAEESKRKALEIELAGKRQDSSLVTPVKKETARHTRSPPKANLEATLRLKESELEEALDREMILQKNRDDLVLTLNALMDRSAPFGSYHRTPPHRRHRRNPDVTKLEKTRTDLLASGIYREDDDVIKQIDKRIFGTASS